MYIYIYIYIYIYTSMEGFPRAPWNPLLASVLIKVMEVWPSTKLNYLDCNH